MKLKSPFIKQEHWNQILKEIGRNETVDMKTLNLEKVFSFQLHTKSEKVQEVYDRAK